MEFPDKTLWRPAPEDIEAAALTALARRLQVDGYDALYRLSIAEPERYWRACLQHLGIEWFVPWTTFCALPRGPAFPEWFVGGRLNWVHNALKWAEREERAAQPALIAESEDGQVQAVTYAELSQRVRVFAAGLQAQGVARGDRLGLMLPMGTQAVVAFLAIAALGAIAVPLFTGFGGEAVAARLQAAQAHWLLVAESFQRRGRFVPMRGAALEAARALPALRLLDPADIAAHSGPPLAQLASMAAGDPFMLVFTSGTTGAPKGTVHTHGGFPLKIAHDCAYHFELCAGDRWLWPSDMGWIVGPITTVGALTAGATLVCYDGAPDFPSWGRFAALIQRHRVTHFGASPTLIRALAAQAEEAAQADLGSLKLLMAAGEVLDPEHFEWFFRGFGRGELPVINYTGGTEASGALLASVPVRPIKVSGFNSVSPGVQAFAADAQGQPVHGEVGELSIAAPFVGMTQSFWQDDARYLEAYWQAVPGVWTHGDLVYQDADGHFFVLGRSDDTLKLAGKRLGPAEVEAVVLALPGVREAAAVGLHDARKGQKLVLLVVARDAPAEASALPAQVADAVEAALGKPFRPAAVHCVAELPRTRNGKLLRRVIRRVLAGEAPGDLSALENPAAVDAVREVGERGKRAQGGL